MKLFKEDKDGSSTTVEGLLWILADVTAQRLEEYMARNFLSLISHKFKTPLASINGYAQILNDEADSKSLPEVVKKSAATIMSQGAKLTGLVESILDFVTVDSMEVSDLKKTEFDVAELFDDTVEVMKARFRNTEGLNFKVVVTEAVKVKADKALVKTALKALVDNAVKFNAGKDKLIILSAQAKDGHALISIGDNGPGIPGEEIANIFNKFYQVEASFTGQVEGWGLGLALVKKAAEVHGGSVYAKSQLQKGSAFTLVLPL